MKTKFLSLAVLVSVSAFIVAIGFSWLNSRVKLVGTTSQMRGELLRRIPQGTTISGAQSTMESQGFRCSTHLKGTFDSLGDGETKNIVYCYKRPYFDTDYTVGLIYENERVVDVKVLHSPPRRGFDF